MYQPAYIPFYHNGDTIYLDIDRPIYLSIHWLVHPVIDLPFNPQSHLSCCLSVGLSVKYLLFLPIYLAINLFVYPIHPSIHPPVRLCHLYQPIHLGEIMLAVFTFGHQFHWILVMFSFFHQVFRPTMLSFRVCDVWHSGSRKSSSWLALEFLCQQTCPTFAPREDFTISCGIQQTSPLQRPFSHALWFSLTQFYLSLCGFLCFECFPSLDRLVPMRANIS